MKTFLNITAIFLMLLFGWWALFLAIAEPVNIERILDHGMWQARQEMMEVNNGK